MSSDTSRLTPDLQRHRQQLRRALRAARRSLPPSRQRRAAQDLANRLLRLPGMARVRDVAAYVASDGEIDPMPALRQLARRGVRIWLPVLTRHPQAKGNDLHFARMPSAASGRAGWQRNRFGIAEPRTRQRRAAWTLDLLWLPLVGFDRHGQRLGMGGGFYDRLLAGLARRPTRPGLIGLAHALQQVDTLPVAAWDQPVDAVVTDLGTH